MRARFADFVLDLDRRELLRGGASLHAPPKALRLLELLLREAPSAVSKEHIYRELWGTSFVEEANIPNLISDLRTLLGDESSKSRFVQTVHRFGYRFGTTVQWEELEVSNRDAAARWWLVWGSRQFPLKDGENVIGRDQTAAVMLDCAGVSRRHARVIARPTGSTVEDLGSKNGTFVNGAPVRGTIELRDGDTILVGTASVTFHQVADRDTTLSRITG